MKTLKTIVISQDGKSMVVRINFDDGTFVENKTGIVPRFDIGETLTIIANQNVEEFDPLMKLT